MNLQRVVLTRCTPLGLESIEHVTWTPGQVTMDPHAHLPSTWRGDHATKPLTNRAIARYAREGRYGKALQLRVAKADEHRATKVGIVYRCACGASQGVRYLRYGYLPQPGYWCPKCQAVHRATRDKEQELHRQFKERIRNEYV